MRHEAIKAIKKYANINLIQDRNIHFLNRSNYDNNHLSNLADTLSVKKT